MSRNHVSVVGSLQVSPSTLFINSTCDRKVFSGRAREINVTTFPKMPSYKEEIKGLVSVQLYNAAACNSLIKHVNHTNGWSEAAIGEETGETYQSAVRPEYRAAFAFTPPSRSKIQKEFDLKIKTIVRPLVREVWRRDFKRLEGTHLVRYLPGGFYVSHADAGLDVNDRYFTILCYLNENFSGGQTSFPTLDFAVTPQTGKAIIFPATYIHRAEPVLKGRKYILVSWLTASDPIRWI
jgi:hypothetical protein